MKPKPGRRFRILLIGSALLSGLAAADPVPSPVEQVAEKAVADYTARLAEATRELEAARVRITAEKAPAVERLQSLERSIVALRAEVTALQETQAQADERTRQLQKEEQTLTKNTAYLHNLAHELTRAVKTGLVPGEDGTPLAELQQALEAREAGSTGAAVRAFDLALVRLQAQLGGHLATGKAVEAGSNRIAEGTFGFFGPEAVFVAQDGTLAGPVVAREGSPYPVVYPLAAGKPADALPLAGGGEATVLLDPTGGKALSLRQTTGTFWEHVEKGGIMALVIIATGIVAAGLALHKLWETRALRPDPPEAVNAALAALAGASPEAARAGANRLQGTTRGLFLAGVSQLDQSKDVIEEALYGFTLGQRLHHEKRLPLLAVIATAAPLMGLLGTVMGMVKTFALITVFGTGNAARLSSGISEILVTTELGLAVAIPALVVHGFLSHRIQKKLSQLERQAVDFLAAVSRVKSEGGVPVPGGVAP